MEILEGNIGYLDLCYFSGVKPSGETAVAAMNFLSNANAVIIDLRKNGGGNPSMIPLTETYFLLEGQSSIRLEFVQDESSGDYQIIVHFSDGGNEVVYRVKGK